ncbi:hypothetical protein CIN01S_04_05660 [Chryseobacterium indologenes NBRC 14944]|nr:hypothetical protein CIN01S_04_05660 [Chryseobacterium indologenes NBRC 14944]
MITLKTIGNCLLWEELFSSGLSISHFQEISSVIVSKRKAIGMVLQKAIPELDITDFITNKNIKTNYGQY